MTGSNRYLLTLILRSIRTGLSHGTVDVIYRLNTGSKSRRVLDNRIVECTGFWEYLADAERAWLLRKLSAEMEGQDVLVLTFLRHNPQQGLFEAMNFKQLRSPLETMLPRSSSILK